MNDHNLAEKMLSAEMQAKIKDAGFKVTVSYDEFACGESPRDFGGYDSVWINVDIPIPPDVDKGKCIDDFMKNYCREKLGCKVSDVVWSPVYRYEHDGCDHSLTPFQCRFDSGLNGVIYMTKDKVREIYDVKRVSRKTEEKVLKDFTAELDIYTDWCNGEIYCIEMFDQNGYFLDVMGSIYLTGAANLDVYAEEVLNNALHNYEIRKKEEAAEAENEKDVEMA